MSDYLKALQKIGQIFSNDKNDFLELTATINQYKNIVEALSSVNIGDKHNKENLYFNNGKALGTTWAAMCLDDILRTKQFITGIFKAIETLQKKQQKPIHILYAGTGPYATLLLPILASFSPNEVKVTLVEINKESFNNMKHVIHKLGLDNHVFRYENEDATTLKINPDLPVHIIVSETLQCGLVKEQQVPITLNLLHQVENNVILIPEMLALDVCLFNHNNFTNRNENTKEETYLQVLDRLIEINNSSNEAFKLNTVPTVTTILSEKKITINPNDATTFDALVLVTRMTIFQDITIDLNQSGLTVPIILDVISNYKEEKTFTISYKIDSEPGFVMHWL